MKRFIARLLVLILAVSLFFIAPAFAQSSSGSAAPSAGDTVCFGCYEQGSGCSGEQTSIEWTVLDEREGMVLLISKTGLETGPFNSEKQRATWAESSLREWLNCSFLYEAFTQEEQCVIMETTIATPAGSFKSPVTRENIKIAKSPDTEDLVFLLSVSEVKKYFPKESQRRSRNNSYLLDKPESTMPYPAEGDPCNFTYGNWWLRDVRQDKGINSVFHVKSSGSIASAGQVNLKRYVIRPAIWVDANYPFVIAD